MSTTIHRKDGVITQNLDIRREANAKGVKLWQIAEALGLLDCNFSRKLRRELPQQEKEKIIQIIHAISEANAYEKKAD